MEKMPGMSIEVSSGNAEQLLHSLFSSGGLYLSQVCNITGIELHTIQNWVKRGFVSPPRKKLYTKRQLCRIAIINMLRCVLPLDTALHLLRYINGALDDEADDLIDDSLLYLKFCTMIFEGPYPQAEIPAAAERLTADITERQVRVRTAFVLRAMYCAYRSAQFKTEAEQMIASAELKGV